MLVSLYNAEICLYKAWKRKGFFQIEIIRNVLLALSVSFEYICYGSTAIINILLFQCGDHFYRPTSESGVYRRLILTYKDGPCAERVNVELSTLALITFVSYTSFVINYAFLTEFPLLARCELLQFAPCELGTAIPPVPIIVLTCQ